MSAAQAERLAVLVEELGEAIQDAAKVLRHGATNSHPDTGVPNIFKLQMEHLSIVKTTFKKLVIKGSSLQTT